MFITVLKAWTASSLVFGLLLVLCFHPGCRSHRLHMNDVILSEQQRLFSLMSAVSWRVDHLLLLNVPYVRSVIHPTTCCWTCLLPAVNAASSGAISHITDGIKSQQNHNIHFFSFPPVIQLFHWSAVSLSSLVLGLTLWFLNPAAWSFWPSSRHRIITAPGVGDSLQVCGIHPAATT